MSAYRTAPERPIEPPTRPRCGDLRALQVGAGELRRSEPCPLPGFWARWLNGVSHKDRWHCECGAVWEWYVNHWTQLSTPSESPAREEP